MRIQCQTTRLFLDDQHRAEDGIWTCPYCPQAEQYRLAETANPNLHAVVTYAIERARDAFQRPDDNMQTVILMGNRGECVHEADQQTFHIYVSRDNNWLRNCFQGSHEACHRVCTESNAGFWPDEMLSILFSLRFLHDLGLHDGAAINEREMRANAQDMPLVDLLRAPRNAGDPALYGRCFLVAKDLERATGWDALSRLPSHRAADGAIDVDAWLATLSRQSRRWAKRVLTP